jgi:hypothetical protein
MIGILPCDCRPKLQASTSSINKQAFPLHELNVPVLLSAFHPMILLTVFLPSTALRCSRNHATATTNQLACPDISIGELGKYHLPVKCGVPIIAANALFFESGANG